MKNKFIIFVSGILAAGKTTFSEYLSKELGILLINKDYVKEILCETVGFNNREENLKLSTATHKLMRHVTENSMKVGLPIILESNFNPGDAKHFEYEIQKYMYSPITVMLTGDKKILYKRFTERWEARHPAHKSFPLPTWDEFNAQPDDGWERFDVGGEKLTIDTTNFENVRLDEIVVRIRTLIQQLPLSN